MDKLELLNNSPLSYRWSWMKKFVDNGYFDISTDIQKEIVKQMMDTLNTVYKDRWSFQFYHLNKFPHILIYFPKFNISNSEGRTHEILDLYIRLEFNGILDTGPYLKSQITGFRTTLTEKEKSSGYIHSHIYSDSDYFDYFNENYDGCNYRSFCLGTSEVGDLIQLIIGAETFDKNLFELFLLTLDSYVKWESLEGGPYIRMSQISMVRGNTGRYSYNNSYSAQLFSAVNENKELQKKWSYTNSNGNINVVESLDFINSLKKMLVHKKYFYLLCTKSGKDYYKIGEEGAFAKAAYNKYVLFRGSKRYLKIKITDLKNNTSENNPETLHIYPLLLEKFIKIINTTNTQKYINYYAKRKRVEEARKGISLYNLQRKNNPENTVSVLTTQFC